MNTFLDFKPAAMIYMQRLDMDPNAKVLEEHPQFPDIQVQRPAWEPVAMRMFDLAHLLASMKQATVVQPPVQPIKVQP